MFKRLQARANRLLDRGEFTASQAQELVAACKDLVADIQDGVGVSIEIDTDKLLPVMMDIITSKATGKVVLPLRLVVDPSVDKAIKAIAKKVSKKKVAKKKPVQKTHRHRRGS